ncbi:MAG TPA: glycosyltransferase [Gemmataceae bacterium]|nr:glycosyltransferase [Gemmataceae bacterium]
MPGHSLSIVIPTFDRADLLRACLRSVLRYKPAGTEVIVVADGSSGAVDGEFPSVRLLRLAKRSGFCAAANAGIAGARGDVVELLNDDTEVTPGWADAALACFADPGVAAVAPLVLQLNDGSIDSAGDGYDPGGFARKLGHSQSLGSVYFRRSEVFGASGSSAFYRRELFLRVGGFPQNFGAYFEDVDLAFRVHRAGGVILFEPASRVFHHGGSSYGSQSRRLVEQQSCNEERVWWRNLPSRDLILSLPRHLAVLAGKAVRRWREGTLLPWALGRMRAWSEIGRCRRHFRRLSHLGSPTPVSDWHVEPLSA